MSFLKNIKTPDDLLQEYKELKISTINSIRDSKLNTFTYEGNTFQTRPEDRENILGESMEVLMGKTDNIQWIDINNNYITFTPEDFSLFAKAVASHKRECIFKGRNMKDMIMEATTKDQIDSIVWEDE